MNLDIRSCGQGGKESYFSACLDSFLSVLAGLATGLLGFSSAFTAAAAGPFLAPFAAALLSTSALRIAATYSSIASLVCSHR